MEPKVGANWRSSFTIELASSAENGLWLCLKVIDAVTVEIIAFI